MAYKTIVAVLDHFVLKTKMRLLRAIAVGTSFLSIVYVFYLMSLLKVLFLGGVFFAGSVFAFADWVIDLLEWMEPDVVWRIKTKEHVAALTIDDVPLLDSPSTLKKVLAVLKKHDVKATLMVMSGFRDEQKDGGAEPETRKAYNELLQQAVDDGHELGNHMKFDRPAIAMTNAEFDTAFLHCDEFLKNLAGGDKAWNARPRRWFRPASALWNDHMLKRAKEYHYTPVISNCFPFDTVPISRFWNALYLKMFVRKGSVIVIHDRFHVADTLDNALPAIKSTGMELVTLSDLQARSEKELQAGNGNENKKQRQRQNQQANGKRKKARR